MGFEKFFRIAASESDDSLDSEKVRTWFRCLGDCLEFGDPLSTRPLFTELTLRGSLRTIMIPAAPYKWDG